MQNQLMLPRMGMTGFYKIIQHALDANRQRIPGSATVLADWQENLITDGGFQQLGSEKGFLTYLQIGDGTTEPTNADTQLESFLLSSKTTVAEGSSDLTGSPAWVSAVATASFDIGDTPPTITELGISKETQGSLFSHALIKDSTGTAVPVTPFPNASLDIVYEWRIYLDFEAAATIGTLTLAGNTYGTTTHLSNIDTKMALYWNSQGLVNSNREFNAYKGAFNDPGKAPATSLGTLDSKYVSATFVDDSGNYYINVGANIPPTSFVGDVTALEARVINTYLGMKTGFNPPLTKPADQNFFVGIQIPVARFHT